MEGLYGGGGDGDGRDYLCPKRWGRFEAVRVDVTLAEKTNHHALSPSLLFSVFLSFFFGLS